MLIRGEWNIEEAIAVRCEEAREDALEERNNEVLDLIEKGYTTADIKSHLLKQTRHRQTKNRPQFNGSGLQP